jgi:hypothetical protein
MAMVKDLRKQLQQSRKQLTQMEQHSHDGRTPRSGAGGFSLTN